MDSSGIMYCYVPLLLIPVLLWSTCATSAMNMMRFLAFVVLLGNTRVSSGVENQLPSTWDDTTCVTAEDAFLVRTWFGDVQGCWKEMEGGGLF